MGYTSAHQVFYCALSSCVPVYTCKFLGYLFFRLSFKTSNGRLLIV